mmetsp:Transcript_23108/g.55603  ORF Transcript_23108/g.55603 Transcript_23108/m.55603 type:complete len:208 (-) Transcript_23108:33-656(-)
MSVPLLQGRQAPLLYLAARDLRCQRLVLVILRWAKHLLLPRKVSLLHDPPALRVVALLAPHHKLDPQVLNWVLCSIADGARHGQVILRLERHLAPPSPLVLPQKDPKNAAPSTPQAASCQQRPCLNPTALVPTVSDPPRQSPPPSSPPVDKGLRIPPPCCSTPTHTSRHLTPRGTAAWRCLRGAYPSVPADTLPIPHRTPPQSKAPR